MIVFRKDFLRIIAVATTLVFSWPSRDEAAAADRVPADVWQMYESPEEAGFSSDKLAAAHKLYDSINAAGVMIVYDGAVLAAWGDVETRFMCHSVRKSLLSALFGIHVGAGHIDLTKTLSELCIDDNEPALSATEKQATIIDLLTSRSGIYHRSAYEPKHMKTKRPKRGGHKPGTHWFYNNWDFNALLTIFEEESKTTFFEEFRQRLAKPLQMQDFRLRDGYYHHDPEFSFHPAYPFRMSARDMARIGLLMMRDGHWGDKSIIPANWVDKSTRPYSKIPAWNGYTGYGYLWWTAGPPFEQHGMFSALGNGLNSIDVLPKRKLVFVFRADTFRQKSIDGSGRWKLIQAVIDAQQSQPREAPTMVPLPSSTPVLARMALTDDYLQQFPLDIRRALPSEIVAEPVRIDTVDGELVLYTRRPPAMNLDLRPISRDRFIVEGNHGVGVIERDESGAAVRFLFENDLLHVGKQLHRLGKFGEAEKQFSTIVKNFPKSASGYRWCGQCALAKGDAEAAEIMFRRSRELSKGELSLAETEAQASKK